MLIAPGAVLAYGFWTLSEAIAQKNIFQFLWYLLVHLDALLRWGMWVIAALLVIWLGLAFLRDYRWLGALMMGLVALTSLVIFFWATGLPKQAGELFFPFLSLAGLAINAWLVWDGVQRFFAK